MRRAVFKKALGIAPSISNEFSPCMPLSSGGIPFWPCLSSQARSVWSDTPPVVEHESFYDSTVEQVQLNLEPFVLIVSKLQLVWSTLPPCSPVCPGANWGPFTQAGMSRGHSVKGTWCCTSKIRAGILLHRVRRCSSPSVPCLQYLGINTIFKS